MRIYVPVTFATLTDEKVRSGRIDLAPGGEVLAPLATPEMTSDEVEEAEFVALYLAADASARLAAASPGAKLRLVLSCDVPDGSLPAPDGAGQITLTSPLEGARIACAHADDASQSVAIAGAFRELEANEAALDDHDLLWYDVSELGDIPGL
ncbi:DUF6912 family protein [Rarobacter faecitabidus]|nr:hypothetical protein [Rarobacter faecitabidus]